MKGLLAIALCTAMAAAAAQPSHDVLPQLHELSFVELNRAEAMARYGHPNEMWRYRALRALKLQQPQQALQHFQRAARYADKFSQHALSLMYWHGVGTPVDRVQAYAWSDLAAERGYRDLLLLREKMWSQLSDGERGQARRIGPQVYAAYGDDAGRPRMERELRNAFRNATGSRVGATTDRIEIASYGATEGLDLSGRDYYEPQRWQAEHYWQAEDRVWSGKVIVLPMEKAAPAPADDQRPR